jgi:hypothetical protein
MQIHINLYFVLYVFFSYIYNKIINKIDFKENIYINLISLNSVFYIINSGK